MKHRLACLAFILATLPARADTIPFLESPAKINYHLWYISDGWANGPIQSCEWKRSAVTIDDGKILLTLSDRGGKVRPIGCGEMRYTHVTGYGTYEARIKSAAGSGLNTAFFTYTGPGVKQPVHDEIDFEFLGKDPHTVQLNYYVNAKPQDGTVIQLGFDASKEFHDYKFVWEPAKITWYVDGKKVHETKDGVPLPSHPGRAFISLWSGAPSVNGWLGAFNYNAPVSAGFEWVKFTPLN